MTEATAKIGHNLDPAQVIRRHIEDLFNEAKHCLDGKPVTDKKQADMVVKLIGELRDAKTACDDARKDEVKYWNEGKSEVQDRYNPVLKMCKMSIDIAQKALAPWLLSEETAKRERVARLIAESTQAKADADAAIQASAGDLDKRMEAEYRLADAQELVKIAKKAAGENVIKGARSEWDVEISDRTEAARAIWAIVPEEFDDLLVVIAKRRVKLGAREIRGFTITERIRV